MEGEWIGYVYLINGTLSMICGVLLLLLYTFTKSFRQSPGMLIFWHIFSQTFIDTFFAITGFYKVVTKTFPDYMCPILGAFNTYFYLIGFNYSLCLCTEVIKRLQNPMENSYYKRGKVYHIASHSLGIVIALIIFFQKEAGASSNHFCLIKQESIYIYIIALPLVMFTPTLAFTLYIMCKMKAGTSSISFFLVKHSVYITIYFSIWCPVIVNLLLRKDVYESDRNMLSRTSVIACSSSGWVLCMVRLGSYFLIRLLKKSDRSKSKCNSSITKLINESIKDFPDANFLEDSINYKSDYVNAFSSVSTESALTSIIILQLSLQYSSELIDSKPPWDKCLYKEQTKYKVSQKKLKLLRLPKNLRKYFTSQQLEFTEYAGQVFRDIRKIERISNNELANAFDIMNLLTDFMSVSSTPGGRSGSFFIFSIDKKFIIKTISNAELKVLLSNFLISYHAHLNEHQESLISRIIGAYTFSVNRNYEVNFVLMQSVYSCECTQDVYDLKGSKLDREIMDKQKGQEFGQNIVVMKDIDFLKRQEKIAMPNTVAQRLLEILENDTRLFQKFNLMDYSLLLAVKRREEYSKFFFKSSTCKEKGYSIGIIDYLQEYNNTKKFEGISKKILTFKPRGHISSIKPEVYMQRFLNFVHEIIG